MKLKNYIVEFLVYFKSKQLENLYLYKVLNKLYIFKFYSIKF